MPKVKLHRKSSDAMRRDAMRCDAMPKGKLQGKLSLHHAQGHFSLVENVSVAVTVSHDFPQSNQILYHVCLAVRVASCRLTASGHFSLVACALPHGFKLCTYLAQVFLRSSGVIPSLSACPFAILFSLSLFRLLRRLRTFCNFSCFCLLLSFQLLLFHSQFLSL